MDNTKSKRGGKRPGSGRKKKESTETIRIPSAIKADVIELIRQHKEIVQGT